MLSLAERSVCMRECKRCCDVKMFCFSLSDHASTNLKKFFSSKLDKFTLFTDSFIGLNLENLYNTLCQFFFRLSWHFKRKNLYFGKHLLAKQELITWARLQLCKTLRLVWIPLLISAITKSFVFFLRKVIS